MPASADVRRPHTQRRDPQARLAPVLIALRLTADVPDRPRLTDITCVPTGRGVHPARLQLTKRPVSDDRARRFQQTNRGLPDGFRTARRPGPWRPGDDPLTAPTTRTRPLPWSRQPVHLLAFSRRCRAESVPRSMAAPSNCFDGAAVETFLASVKREFTYRSPYRDPPDDTCSARLRVPTARIRGTPVPDTGHPSVLRLQREAA